MTRAIWRQMLRDVDSQTIPVHAIGIVGGPKAGEKNGSVPEFRALTEQEIEDRLQAISEKD